VVYPGTCRVPAAGTADRQGRRPAWRFAVDDRVTCYHDCLAGVRRQNLGREVGDFVVKRRDDLYAYQLAVVVDDALMAVTDVVRGADLLDSTPRQIALQAALDLPTPRYWHVPLLRDAAGRRLSKRDGALSLDDYCEAGGTPEALVGRFAMELRLVDDELSLTPRELLSGLRPADLMRCPGSEDPDAPSGRRT